MKKYFSANFTLLKSLSVLSISIPILLFPQTVVVAFLQWLKLIFLMPEIKLGDYPGWALIVISSGSKSKSVESDCRK